MDSKQDLKSVVAQVKEAYDLADYVRASGVSLQPSGFSKWKGLCPIHNEKNPSFLVSDNFQNYKCWSCGASGDLISFVQHQENLDFISALRKLAADKGIAIDLDEVGDGVDYESHRKALKLAANFYIKAFNDLPDDHRAKTEIVDRGLTWNKSPTGTLFYGYAPQGNQLTKHLMGKGFSKEILIEAGLTNEYSGRLVDFFHSRLIFVFTDRYGKPIGFSSRKLFEDDSRGKYVNTSDTPLFNKSRVLYNHVAARKAARDTRELFVAEGQFDVAAFVAAGIPAAVAASGTAYTRSHALECMKIVGPSGKVTFCFDSDKAGMQAAARVFQNIPDIHDQAYVVVFPEGQDPCDYRQQNGDEALRQIVTSRKPLVEFMLIEAKKKHDLNSVIGSSKYIAEGASIIKTVQDATLREYCIKFLSLEALAGIDTVREAVFAAKPMVDRTSDEDDTNVPSVEDRYRSPEGDSKAPVGVEEDAGGQEDSGSEKTPENGSQAPERPDSGGIPRETLEELIEKDPRYNIAARFLSLGVQTVAWRKALVRAKEIIPAEFHSFLADITKLGDSQRLYPELFQDTDVAEILMQDSFSAYYRLMSGAELKAHFIYLHECLAKKTRDTERKHRVTRVRELLSQEGADSWEYYESLRNRMMEAEKSV